MLCKATLYEFGKTKACWLPADPSSYFGFCRRCHFDKVTSLLDTLRLEYSCYDHPKEETILKEEFFLKEALHKGREQAFLSLLNVVREKRPKLFEEILAILKGNKAFEHLLQKLFLRHAPGPRCTLYKSIIQKCHIHPVNQIYDLPGICWHCAAFFFQKREIVCDLPIFMMSFVMAVIEISSEKLITFGLDPFLRIIASLHLYGRNTYAEQLCEQLITLLPPSEIEHFLLRLFSEPVLLPLVLTKRLELIVPLRFNTEALQEKLYEAALQSIKDRQQKTKEELMERTWHPDRFMIWCLNPEDLSWDI